MICKEIERGDIYVVKFYNHRTKEFKEELVVIIQGALAEYFDKRLSSPLKQYAGGKLHSTHVPLMVDGITYIAKCEFIDAERVENFKQFVRKVTDAELERINKALMISLGLVQESEIEFIE